MNTNLIGRMKIFGFFLVSFCLLAGCENDSSATVMPPTSTVARIVISETPLILSTIPSRTNIPTARPSIRPSMTFRPTISPTITKTPSATLSLNENATHEAKDIVMATFEARYATEAAIFSECGPSDHYYSPDGKWVALKCLNSMTVVYSLSDYSKAWLLKYNEIFGFEDVRLNQFESIIPWHWSVDGHYLYLSVFPRYLDGGCADFHSGEALIRLDLETGKVTQTLQPGSEGLKLYGFTFSKNDTYLAYFRTWLEHPILNIQNLVTGEEQHIPIGDQYDEAGDVIWSPDETRIVFSARTLTDACENIVYYLVMMDLDDYRQTVLLEGPDYHSAVEWVFDDYITVDLGEENYGLLHVITHGIAPYQTPTPTVKP